VEAVQVVELETELRRITTWCCWVKPKKC